MAIVARPWSTAGFAVTLVAASAIAAPVVTHLTALPGAQSREVQLASGDIPWDKVLQTALSNATDIYDHLAPATFADI